MAGTRSIPEFAREALAAHGGSAAHAVVVGTCAGVIEWANSAWEEVTGWSLDGSLGKPVAKVLAEVGVEKSVLAFVSSHYRSGRGCAVQLPVGTPLGNSKLIHVDVKPIFGAQDEISHFMAVATDVSEGSVLEPAGAGVRSRQSPRASVRVRNAEHGSASRADRPRALRVPADEADGLRGVAEIPVAWLVSPVIENPTRLAGAASGEIEASFGKEAPPGTLDLSELTKACLNSLGPRMPDRFDLDVVLHKAPPPVCAKVVELRSIVMDLLAEAIAAVGDDWGTVSVTTGVTDPGRVLISPAYHRDFFGTLDEESCQVFLEVHDTGECLSHQGLAFLQHELRPQVGEGRVFRLLRARSRLEAMGGVLHAHSETGSGTQVLLLMTTA